MSLRLIETEDLLKRLGKETFIKYYFEFEKENLDEILIKFDLNKENWTDISKNTKAKTGISIFKKDLNDLALLCIINKTSKSKVNPDTIEKAKEIYNNIELERKLMANKIEKSLEDSTNNFEEKLFWDLRDLEEERKNITD